MQTFELEKTKQDKKQHTIIIIMPKNNCCHTLFCFDKIYFIHFIGAKQYNLTRNFPFFKYIMNEGYTDEFRGF